MTLEDSNDLPLARTPDGESVIFTSDRNGSDCLYKQRIDQTAPEPITTFPKGGLFGPGRLLRVPIAGGLSAVVMKLPKTGGVSCPPYPATKCVFLHFTDDREGIFTSFDRVCGDPRVTQRQVGEESSD